MGSRNFSSPSRHIPAWLSPIYFFAVVSELHIGTGESWTGWLADCPRVSSPKISNEEEGEGSKNKEHQNLKIGMGGGQHFSKSH